MCIWRVAINTIYPLSGECERIPLCNAGKREQNNVKLYTIIFFF